MQTLRIGSQFYKTSPTRNMGEFTAKLAKCTGKHKKQTPRGGVTRGFPRIGESISTSDYVVWYYTINAEVFYGKSATHSSIRDDALAFFEPLNLEPCAMYDGEDVYENNVIDFPMPELMAA